MRLCTVVVPGSVCEITEWPPHIFVLLPKIHHLQTEAGETLNERKSKEERSDDLRAENDNEEDEDEEEASTMTRAMRRTTTTIGEY